MAYVDSDYYKNTYKGTFIPDAELDSKLELASDDINSLTYNRIIGAGFDNLTPFQQDKIKKAVCIQAEFNYQYGDYLDLPVDSYSAGSVNVSFGKESNGVRTPNSVVNYLSQTGLTCRIL
ncbi:hypothetical protein CPAST_c40320 [Clostridium pasteurianum DSM 525 = ATCC 6013]|uniref:Uncharacterized protein n=1 Tax=Clostridium pasteurianum DSM 525 = ATCC 6013 TaxID=1262449 RepID=A0A0H3J830_CLOPA|nr:hypothetical protein [Clostridium pasteurianum]AJA50061.1 hypothetical protein CPAST_c40320 [Clostridium pasteurianum DSM 525 = ATCC 6013]AJA54049.1 hypothetical protein CLPA_c40320 [Clostridium pasteurianum DSM 525 = ATCC 6013]AOZ77187.1 hypothetical protein AQ983_19605 [Clostridium pasteurianum DSM 525 = ATCC 6013]AOZ80984.1 hypothetical protein AQ984_19600 [Clostridium pasteurianum]ELP59234.1 hypothetical protein F502_10148 [Clostridium pasteurianum DSM 525 = ATCC 6013]